MLPTDKNKLISRLRDKDITVFDFDSIAKSLENPKSLFSGNQKHYNEYGYELLSKELFNFLQSD